jgi:ABC-type transport system substrate-binding protein
LQEVNKQALENAQARNYNAQADANEIQNKWVRDALDQGISREEIANILSGGKQSKPNTQVIKDEYGNETLVSISPDGKTYTPIVQDSQQAQRAIPPVNERVAGKTTTTIGDQVFGWNGKAWVINK